MIICFLLFVAGQDLEGKTADELAALFQRQVDGRSVDWAEPDERDHVKAIRIINALKSMGLGGQERLEHVVAPLLARDFRHIAENRKINWYDPDEDDYVAARRLVALLRSLGPMGMSQLEEVVSPVLAQHFVYHAIERKATWSDPDEKDQAAAHEVVRLLVSFGPAAWKVLEDSVAPVLAKQFVYHARDRNAEWEKPTERDHVAAVRLARLLRSIGQPGYAHLQSSVLPVLVTVENRSIQELVTEISQARIQGTVVRVDYDRGELLMRDRYKRLHRFRLDNKTVVPAHLLVEGVTVVVHFDLRDRRAFRITKASFPP